MRRKKPISLLNFLIVIIVIFLFVVLVTSWSDLDKIDVSQILGIMAGLLGAGYIIQTIRVNNIKQTSIVNIVQRACKR